MKEESVNISGKINQNGEPHIYNYSKFLDWCGQWRGSKIIATFHVIDESSAKQYVYFKDYIIPQFIQGMNSKGNYYSETGALEFIQSECPLIEEVGKVDFFNMNKSKLNQVIEWLKQYMAENLDIYIND